MQFIRLAGVGMALCLVVACSSDSGNPNIEIVEDDSSSASEMDTGLPKNPSTVRLPEIVVISSDKEENFGINMARLSKDHASVVASAWRNYQHVIRGGEPNCTAAYGASDGGTITYFCEGYDLTRVHGLAVNDGVDGFDYGPSLDLLNGQRVEQLRFYSLKDMQALEQAAP